MPLGRQFRNTFFTNDEGQTTYYSDPHTHPQNVQGLEAGIVAKDSGRFKTPQIHTAESEYELGAPHQGMLFDPHTGTGLKEDPLIPTERRAASFQRGLGLSTTQEYIQNARYLPKSKQPGEVRARKAIGLITEAAVGSGIPTQFAENIGAKAVLDPSKGRAHITGDKRIKLNEEKRTKYIAPEVRTVPAGVAGAPIPNKSFSKAVNNVYWDSDEGAHAEMVGHATFFNEKGEPYKLHSDLSEAEHDFRDLPEGHSANVWPGTGKDTEKYITHTFKVWDGYHERGGERYRTFHTRHERIPTGGTQELPSEATRKLVPHVSKSTLVHEIGHALDPNLRTLHRERDSVDPVIEATADAFTDRHSRNAYNYEEALQPSESRKREIETTGYKTSHHVVKSTKLSKALYVAVRTHAAMSDNQSIPNRDTFAHQVSGADYEDRLSHANEMLLGHLHHHHDHVRKMLGMFGLSDVGQQAEQKYLAHQPDAVREHPSVHPNQGTINYGI